MTLKLAKEWCFGLFIWVNDFYGFGDQHRLHDDKSHILTPNLICLNQEVIERPLSSFYCPRHNEVMCMCATKSCVCVSVNDGGHLALGQVQKKWGVLSVMLFIMISTYKFMYGQDSSTLDIGEVIAWNQQCSMMSQKGFIFSELE